MATYNRAASGMGYYGHPALIFFLMVNYGKGTQTYEERRVMLHKWYSHLRAYLPEMIKTDDEIEIDNYNKNIDPLLKEAEVRINLARQLYKPTFEGLATCDPDERLFQTALEGIVELLDLITAKSKIIGKIKMEDSGDVIG